MARPDPALLAHLEWLGFVQPTGLVVSAPALVKAGAILDQRDAHGQTLLRECTAEREFDPKEGKTDYLPDFQRFAERCLGWDFAPPFIAGAAGAPIPAELEVPLVEYGETLRPDFAVQEPGPPNGQPPWQLLVKVLPAGQAFDKVVKDGSRLEASPQGRMERLLRQTTVPAGLLFNGRALRLISAPRGESSGWIDFQVAAMVETAGRPICSALRLLLGQPRLLSLPQHQRLAALLLESRKYQNEVSERLAEQVLHGLYELLRGFQAAHDASHGQLLKEPLAERPNQVYRALLTVMLRLVFLLYTEERELLPDHEVFTKYYSLAELYKRLREDAALYPDTMDQRFGAWAQLLVLFRLIFDGAEGTALHLPRRHGVLFDPDRFPFLEGRTTGGARQSGERVEPPLVPDGTIYRTLENLLVLDGERLSYRALDVEQIGSVYETMMGFRLERAAGRSVAVRSSKKHGAPVTINLDALLATSPTKRKEWLQTETERDFPERVGAAVKAAVNLTDLHAALEPVINRQATPDLIPAGAMILQPSEERRRSGSHYTPRALTEPIVKTTLEPILARLRGADGRPPRPEQILELKICDPAMGSGAFLVEACRQLGEALIESWNAHDARPAIPLDEDEVVCARRLVAQRCLYGVDKNPVAVDLAKVSLWLVTLARDHALTFVDHALRHGDSLVGLSRAQLQAFHWETGQPFLAGLGISEPVAQATDLRQRIRNAGEAVSDWELRDLWDQAQTALGQVRLYGDLALAAFFEGKTAKERETKRQGFLKQIYAGEALNLKGWLEEWREAEQPLVPFHWEIEFTEVFERENPGFDGIVGNPPFLGGSKISSNFGYPYLNWLMELHEETHGNGDLVAHFFRRAFHLIRKNGAFGLIATNTVGQGDTRKTGLTWICENGGQIFFAKRRVKWPGAAVVVVSVIAVEKGEGAGIRKIDDVVVPKITAFLFHRGGDGDPGKLSSNSGLSFSGAKIYGQGFIFDDDDPKGISSPISEMEQLLKNDPRSRDLVFPYIGGEEVNSKPDHSHHRFVISFGNMTEEEARNYPELMRIVEEKVKPERLANNREGYRRYWWHHGEKRVELWDAIKGLKMVLANSSVSQHVGFAFLPSRMVFSHALIVFPLETYSAFCALQSRPHEIWARFFGSSMKDDLRYTPSDCFETFPFPKNWINDPTLEAAGKEYYEFRAALMIQNNEGLTKTYNRFHDPYEKDPAIQKLRDLHAAMDRAVLDAYGWTDIPTACEFRLDYEIDEEGWGKRKKPYRFRWPEEVHDEVLGRLLELNEIRAREESRSGLAAAKKGAKGKKSQQRGLF